MPVNYQPLKIRKVWNERTLAGKIGRMGTWKYIYQSLLCGKATQQRKRKDTYKGIRKYIR